MALPNMTLNRHWDRHPPRPVARERGRALHMVRTVCLSCLLSRPI
jgi:hypothetical protein